MMVLTSKLPFEPPTQQTRGNLQYCGFYGRSYELPLAQISVFHDTYACCDHHRINISRYKHFVPTAVVTAKTIASKLVDRSKFRLRNVPLGHYCELAFDAQRQFVKLSVVKRSYLIFDRGSKTPVPFSVRD